MIGLAFFLALSALFLQGIIVPHITILAFAPYLAFVLLCKNLTQALWHAALAGVILDLLCDDPIGLHALNYVLITALLFRVRSHFSHDQPLHVSLLTFLFSLFSTLAQLLLLFLFDRRVPFDGKWALIDFALMPLIDALYAFVWFAAPLSLAKTLHRMWTLFWLKNKNPSPQSH